MTWTPKTSIAFWAWADSRSPAPDRHPRRGADRAVPPQPGPIPAAVTGELIPLLQIAPSKTDAERLLVSPPNSPTYSAPSSPASATPTAASPRRGLRHPRTDLEPAHAAVSNGDRAWKTGPSAPPDPPLARTALAAAGLTDAAGSPLRVTPHDFRRLFLTDAIMHGMPPHIAQLVAGHRDINTTMGYKAAIPKRSSTATGPSSPAAGHLRPGEEYRTPTDEEWEEFLGHFERRRVALGDCGRSYSSPCIHEHGCLRCPLLRPVARPAAPHRSRSAPTCSTASPRPNTKAGPARSKDSRSASPPRQQARPARPDGPPRRHRPPRHPHLPRHRRPHRHHHPRPAGRQGPP